MKKRSVAAFILVVYSAVLVRLMVFKINLLEIGTLRIKFSTRAGEGNFLPFKTILSCLRGEPSWAIALLNLVGNIALLVPIGFLVPFVYRKITWQKSLALAAAAGFAIEGMEVLFSVGIFDIDDVILNALGVMIGYRAFTLLAKRARPNSTRRESSTL